MAFLVSDNKKRTKPWIAKRKRDGEVLLLEYCPTKTDAEELEKAFDIAYPSRRHKHGANQWKKKM